MNLYAYVGGNPVNFVDPRGLFIGPLDDAFISGFFIGWYFGDNGVLHLDQYFDSYVKNAIHGELEKIRKKIEEIKAGSCGECVSGTLSENYDMTLSDGLFAMGNGTLKAHYECCDGKCKVKYEIRDEFKDPVDTFDWVDGEYELPGATPYDMNWDYHETI